MPGKERDLQVPENLSGNGLLMKRLLESFGRNKWGYSRFWADQEGEFAMMLQTPGGRKRFEYQDRGTGPGGSCVEINFWEGFKLVFSLRQDVGKGKNGPIENHILVGPFKEEYFDPEWGFQIHYWPDGAMRPLRNVKGFPRKIDTEKTVNAFIDQIIDGRFDRPQLVLPKK